MAAAEPQWDGASVHSPALLNVAKASQQSSAPTTSTGKERHAISELIADAEQGLRDTHTHIEEVQQVIARRRAIGADLAESLKLLENLGMIADLRERPVYYLHECGPGTGVAPAPRG